MAVLKHRAGCKQPTLQPLEALKTPVTEYNRNKCGYGPFFLSPVPGYWQWVGRRVRREHRYQKAEHLTPLASELFRKEWTTSVSKYSHYLLAKVDLGKGACFQMHTLCSDFWFKNFFKRFFHDCSEVWPSLYKDLKNSKSRNTLKILWLRHLLWETDTPITEPWILISVLSKTPSQFCALKSSLWKDPSQFLRTGICFRTWRVSFQHHRVYWLLLTTGANKAQG